MIEAKITALIEAYRPKIAGSKTDQEAVAHWCDLVREVAAQRAGADFMLFTHEAELSTGKEDPTALRERLQRAIADQRSAFAKLVVEGLDHVKGDPVQRERYERFVSDAYGESFDKLLKAVGVEGTA